MKGGDIFAQMEVISMPYDAKQYAIDFIRENYDQVVVKIPKGKKKILEEEAEVRDTSVNKLVISAIEKQYGVNLTKKGT